MIGGENEITYSKEEMGEDAMDYIEAGRPVTTCDLVVLVEADLLKESWASQHVGRDFAHQIMNVRTSDSSCFFPHSTLIKNLLRTSYVEWRL